MPCKKKIELFLPTLCATKKWQEQTKGTPQTLYEVGEAVSLTAAVENSRQPTCRVPAETAGPGLGRAGCKVWVTSAETWGNHCYGWGCLGQRGCWCWGASAPPALPACSPPPPQNLHPLLLPEGALLPPTSTLPTSGTQAGLMRA